MPFMVIWTLEAPNGERGMLGPVRSIEIDIGPSVYLSGQKDLWRTNSRFIAAPMPANEFSAQFCSENFT